MSSVADRVEVGLRAAGYTEQRWYPIGTKHEHGFAVTTRLEHIADPAHPGSAERWNARYPDAATLKWLAQARDLPLSGQGRYRVLLVAYTDLPIGRSPLAPIWNELTMMDGPGALQASSARDSGVPPRGSSAYRFGIYEYEYRREGQAGRAAFQQAQTE